MRSKERKAAAGTTARCDKRHHIEYRKVPRISRPNLKEAVGTLLLYLQSPLTAEQQQNGWLLFEVLLSRYLQEQYTAVQLPNSGQGVAE